VEREAAAVMSRVGIVEVFMSLMVGLIPLAILGWLLSLAVRAVRALESIAESLRQRGRP
jgi:hypothetical protein